MGPKLHCAAFHFHLVFGVIASYMLGLNFVKVLHVHHQPLLLVHVHEMVVKAMLPAHIRIAVDVHIEQITPEESVDGLDDDTDANMFFFERFRI